MKTVNTKISLIPIIGFIHVCEVMSHEGIYAPIFKSSLILMTSGLIQGVSIGLLFCILLSFI